MYYLNLNTIEDVVNCIAHDINDRTKKSKKEIARHVGKGKRRHEFPLKGKVVMFFPDTGHVYYLCIEPASRMPDILI